jgi:hypothetical protein
VFQASASFLLFDYFRVPYEQVDGEGRFAGCGWVRSSGDDSKAVFWVPASLPAAGRVTGAHNVGSIPVFGGMLPDKPAKTWLAQLGGEWHRTTPIYDLLDARIASIWTTSEGKVFLPFDPNEAIVNFWSEGYADFIRSPLTKHARSVARHSYYRVRSAMPRQAQIAARRWFSRIQSRTSFPHWPVETALHDLYQALFQIVVTLVEQPVPMISAWPAGKEWALILTHDVETSDGYEKIDLLRDIELSSDYRSSWNFVPMNDYLDCDSLIEELKEGGFEVGVHGLYHDGRDISDLADRLPLIRQYAERWSAVGFRSPSTLRDWKAMPLLRFDYDSTYFDTSPFEPQPGGCCTWLPYMIGDTVELPITLAQDHTLFEILGGSDEQLWLGKARFLRERGGMALVLTHPDYAHNERVVRAYTRLLDEFAGDATAWKALPRDVSDWWRRRAASEIQLVGGDWRVVGPAADQGKVSYVDAGSA